MSDFQVHLTSGLIAGAGVAAAGIISKDLMPVQAGAVIIVGTTGGLIPDIDSDTGKPIALLFQLISVLAPVLLYPHIKPLVNPDTPFLLCYFTLVYLGINYLVCPMIKKLTRHRGMMHSIPFAFLSAEAAFLLLYPSGFKLSAYGAVSVFSGCMIHLILDELNSMSLKFGFIVVVKRSTGSALKFIGPNLLSTVATYFLIGLCGYVIVTKSAVLLNSP